LNNILLLEDDPLLAKSLQKFLHKNGYTVIWVKDAQEAMDKTFEEKYTLYLFDINVPLMKGDDLLKSLREAGDTTPTILISALIDIDSITKGFRSGADDYIKKPFDPQELLVRIEAKTTHFIKTLTYKEYTVTPNNDEIFYKDEMLYLPHIQKQLFISLIKNYPNPATKDELLLLLEKASDIALRVNMTKLKAKLKIDIENIRGVGYKLA